MSCKPPPDVSLILLGSQRYGVSSANRILGGTQEFEWEMRNIHNITRSGEVNGKRVQLVKAPVWFRGYHLTDTTQEVKDGLVLSVTQCQPGPHALLLTVEVDLPFTSACANSVKAHLSLFGEDIWSHTIIVFTCADWLGNTSIEEYIEGEGAHLSELLHRCGHRYVVDCTSQSTALSVRVLEKVQELLKTNGDRHFEINQSEIQRILQNREEVNRRAEQRRQRKERKTRQTGAFISDINIVLLGWVFAAKSSVYRALCPSQNCEGDGRTEKCVFTEKTVVDSTVQLRVWDIPGWWKFFDARLVPHCVRAEINKAFECTKTSHIPYSKNAFLLMLPADTSFKLEQLKILRENMKLLGESVWDKMIVVFTGGSWIRHLDIDLHIESEGEALVWLVEQCGNRYFVFNADTEPSGMEAQGKQLIEMVMDLCKTTLKKSKSPKPYIQEETPVEPVDEDLVKMVEVLHRVWAWRQWEIEEIKARLDNRPLEFKDNWSMDEVLNLNRAKVEDIVKDETGGKSLEEMLKIVSEIYFRKECGAFDIVSIICQSDQFKPEWKCLFEREWARRESRLMEYTFTTYFKASDETRIRKESCDRVKAWLDSPEWLEEVDFSIKEPVTNIITKIKKVDQNPIAVAT